MLDIYGPKHIQLYSTATMDTPPHIYKLADEAYRNICFDGQNQSCIISGESGAGKTEAAKKILEYIAAISGEKSQSTIHIKQCIKDTNPILESFGNAKTVLKVHNLNKCTSCSRSKKRHHVCLHCFDK